MFLSVSECNLTKEDEEIVSDDKNMNIPEESLGNSTGCNFQEKISNGKEDQTKIDSDKYSKLLSILSGKGGDIDTFIEQYTIWQQSQSNTGKKNNAIKSPKGLQKTKKSKTTSSTPLVKLKKRNCSKKMNKDSNIKR